MSAIFQFKEWFRGSLRRKMILTMVGTIALLVSLVMWDVTRRQHEMLLKLQADQAENLARAMGGSAAGWLEAHDVAGLQEIVDAQKQYPELQFAMFLDQDGKVLAHTDRSRLGQYVRDLPTSARAQVLQRTTELVDVQAPVMLSGELVGWVRLGFGQLETRAHLSENTRNGLVYAFVAIGLGSLIAGLVSTRFTRRLRLIQEVSEAVKTGRTELRVAPLGEDEAGRLAQDFNAMLDAMTRGTQELQVANENLRASQADALRQMEAAQRSQRVAEQYSVQLQQEATSRQRAEEAMRLQSAALQAAANTIVITDLAGQVIWANQAFTVLTGYTVAETLGRKLGQVVGSGTHDREFFRQLWATITAGKVWRGEIVNRRKDGQLYREEMTITPIRSARDEITHYIAIKQDITQRKKEESERRHIEEQLRQSQKMEAVGRLAGGVAHDFNNLLTAILGNAQLLQIGGLSPAEQATSLAQVRGAAQRAAGLTKQLLAFSRQQPVAFARVNLNEVVENMARLLPRMLGEDVRVVQEFTREALPVEADTTMLDQVLLNIAINARDAMPRGGTLRIATARVHCDEHAARENPDATAGEYARLSLADSGCGIDPQVLPRIFEPFFTTKDIGKGTGLGLATVYGIVRQHKGWISVQSKIGQGTTFHIHLPLQTTAAPAAEGEAGAFGAGREECILVVEDEDNVRTILTEILRRSGYRVLAASNGQEGLALWRQNRQVVKMLLTDIVMPGGMDGHALAAQILAEAPELKVGYMTGYMRPGGEQSTQFKAGAHYLAKPFEIAQLTKFVKQVLEGAPS
jgi:PAS domain S-box-containing protein